MFWQTLKEHSCLSLSIIGVCINPDCCSSSSQSDSIELNLLPQQSLTFTSSSLCLDDDDASSLLQGSTVSHGLSRLTLSTAVRPPLITCHRSVPFPSRQQHRYASCIPTRQLHSAYNSGLYQWTIDWGSSWESALQQAVHSNRQSIQRQTLHSHTVKLESMHTHIQSYSMCIERRKIEITSHNLAMLGYGLGRQQRPWAFMPTNITSMTTCKLTNWQQQSDS